MRDPKFTEGRRFIRPKTFWAMLGISPAAGWRRVKTDPRFPRPITLGPQTTAFVFDEAQTYIESLIAERDSAEV